MPLLWCSHPRTPAGCVAGLPAILTGLHWFVHSLATPMRFTLIQAGQPPVQGLALAHMEKNWGQSFPSRWHWAQGLNASSGSSSSCSSDGADGSSGGGSSSSSCGSGKGPRMQAAFALAGGKLPMALLPEGWLPDLWLLGVRTGNRRQAAEGARWQQGGSVPAVPVHCVASAQRPCLASWPATAWSDSPTKTIFLTCSWDFHLHSPGRPLPGQPAAHRLAATGQAGCGCAGKRGPSLCCQLHLQAHQVCRLQPCPVALNTCCICCYTCVLADQRPPRWLLPRRVPHPAGLPPVLRTVLHGNCHW